MDFIGKPVKEEIVAFIKEQQDIIRENGGSHDEFIKSGDALVHRRTHNPTSEDVKWLDAHLNIAKAIIHTCKHLTTWHTSRIRTATGISKMAWFMYLRPDVATSPFESSTKEALQEYVAMLTYLSGMFMSDVA